MVFFNGTEVSCVVMPKIVVGDFVEDLDHSFACHHAPKKVVTLDESVKCLFQARHVMPVAHDFLAGMRRDSAKIHTILASYPIRLLNGGHRNEFV
jgi:hypothetical protein